MSLDKNISNGASTGPIITNHPQYPARGGIMNYAIVVLITAILGLGATGHSNGGSHSKTSSSGGGSSQCSIF